VRFASSSCPGLWTLKKHREILPPVNFYVENVMHQTPMFCIPDGTLLDGPGLFGMVRDMIGGDPKFAQAAFELVIVAGLIKNYPCRS
jgi:hypothetical protein